MALRNWRWGHWLAMSLLLGGVVGLVLTHLDFDDVSLQSVPFRTMEMKLTRRRTDAGEPVLARIRVGPAVRDGQGRLMQPTTFWERQKNKVTGQWDFTNQYRTYTPIPMSPGSPRPDFGMMDFLADQKKAMPSLDYKYQWWLVPRNTWLLAMGGSVLLVGVLWPFVMKQLVRLGLGAPPDERQADLSQVRVVDNSAVATVGTNVTAADQQRLADLNAELEANVADMAMTNVPKPAANVPLVRPLTPVRVLAEGPAAPAAAAVDDESSADFKGEFYPVARPVVKKD